MLMQFTEAGIAALAARLLESFLLSVGLTPTGDFDPADPACVRHCGAHTVYTCSAVVPSTPWCASPEMLQAAFARYLYAYNGAVELPKARFGMYGMEFYPGTYVGGTYYVSIYQ